MKFLFLSSFAHLALDPASDRVSGGAELQVALLARELARRGYAVVLAGGDIGQPDGTILQGVKTRVAGKFHTGNAGDTLQALPHVFSVLRQERPTHVLVLGWTAWLFVLHLLKPFFGYKLVFICGLDTEVDGGFRRENPVRGALAGGDFVQFVEQARRMHHDHALTAKMGAESARFVRELHNNAAETQAFLSGIGLSPAPVADRDAGTP